MADTDLVWGSKGPKAILIKIGNDPAFKVSIGAIDWPSGEYVYESERDTKLGRRIRIALGAEQEQIKQNGPQNDR